MTKRLPGLDPRNPWVIDTRELPRGAGSMREVTRDAPAPAHFGTEMIAVPEGANVHLEVKLESVSEGVWLTGIAQALGHGECGRCLEPVRSGIRASFSELYAYPGNEPEDPDDPDSPDVSVLIDDLIDLEPIVRDVIVLGFPLTPLCRAECRGLCSECGIRLDDLGDDAEDHGHETIDPRWAALGALANPRSEPEER